MKTLADLAKNAADPRNLPQQPLPRADNPRRKEAPLPAPAGEIKVLPVQGNIYLVSGAGANVVMQIGDDGVLLVDSGAKAHAEKVLAAIRQTTDKPIRFIINTHFDLDHIGGNELLGKPGAPTVMVMANEGVLRAASAAKVPVPAWPTDTYASASKDMFANGEAIQLFHHTAHTRGDSLVFFRRSDVVVAGDIYDITRYPVVDVAQGGTFAGILDALNHIIEITVPKDWQDGGTLVVPAQGRVADESDVVEYRDMLTIIGDRVAAMIKKGMTIDQVQAARPTYEYDGRYGMDAGPWTTKMFVETIYRELKK
jgi:glyoxylase-like metal-dependent hydrolase (beta-lactamase superfamily II)